MTHHELKGETDFSRDLFDVEGILNTWGNGVFLTFLEDNSAHKLYVFIDGSWIKIESNKEIDAIHASGNRGLYNVRTWNGTIYKVPGDTPLMWLDGTQEFLIPE